uniref:Potassium channel domain-containing protein n=1 Tax=Panagrolaimus sp. JU765 TaxID=591449 RepID=A0AC34Q6F8_9BILA
MDKSDNFDDGLSPETETSKSTALGPRDQFLKIFKIAVPHFVIYLALMCYLLTAAYIFHRLEDDDDRLKQINKLKEIQAVYARIAHEIEVECGPGNRAKIYKSLSKLSSFMEKRPFELSPDQQPDVEMLLPPRWNKMSSLLFALSILTTTGYPYANPTTTVGQCVAIVYGLFGIPLMVLAAVDIGRFLSDIVIWGYSKFENASFVSRLFKTSKKPSIGNCKKKSFRSWRGKRMSNGGLKHLEEAEKLTPSADSVRYKKLKTRPKNAQEKPKKRLPLSVNASILLLFCMLGGVVYAAGHNDKNFIEGFFVTFNLVANLTMGEVPNDFTNLLTVIYITLFVVFGVAVLSMSADLAAGELKWVFLKIHYFGRKINWKRRDAKKAEMEVEVKELLKIISQIRAKYPEKSQITHVDILQYMHELSIRDKEYYMKQHRRDTIAFMPQSIEALKFADDMDMDDASHRSVQAPIPFLDSETSSLLDLL